MSFYCQAIGIIIASISMYLIHPFFALILISWGIVFTVISISFLKPLQHASYIFAASRSSLVGKMVDSISNVMNVRLFARHDDENAWMNKNMNRTVKNDKALALKVFQMRTLWDICILFLMEMDILVLSYLFQQNRVSIGDFSFITSLSVTILWNFWFLSGKFIDLSDKMGKAKQALSILKIKHQIIDKPEAKNLRIHRGEIDFKNVVFSYPGRKNLFNKLDLHIPAGQKIGLVGFSGSGKSSFVNLILRLFDVKQGGIYIDNQNIKSIRQHSLRQYIALIPQDVSLFHRSIFENVRYARPDASLEEVIAACKKAHCDEFIKRQPKGYYTLTGERGVKLSGGQKQRIAIARAILKNAPILILDEATSALDSVTERYIQETLHQIIHQKTCIVIAHRLSTLAEMDRIIVFDHGKIIEDGSHEALLALNGHYAKLWQLQSGGFIPD